MAAYAGVPPRCQLTFRELVITARERMDESWWHTAQLAAGVVNLFAKRYIPPREFHPFYTSANAASGKKSSGLSVKEFNEAIRTGSWRFQ